MGETEEIGRRMVELTEKLRELRRSLPAHSAKPEMLVTIEETEEEIEELRRRRELVRGRQDPQKTGDG